MPPVIYPPLDNPDRALIHLAASHGHRAADLTDTDLLALQVEHYDDHAGGCDHVHEPADEDTPTFPDWPWEACEP